MFSFVSFFLLVTVSFYTFLTWISSANTTISELAVVGGWRSNISSSVFCPFIIYSHVFVSLQREYLGFVAQERERDTLWWKYCSVSTLLCVLFSFNACVDSLFVSQLFVSRAVRRNGMMEWVIAFPPFFHPCNRSTFVWFMTYISSTLKYRSWRIDTKERRSTRIGNSSIYDCPYGMLFGVLSSAQ